MSYTIHAKKIEFLEQMAKIYGDPDKSYLVFTSVHKSDCMCETCLKWWIALGPVERDGVWDFGPFTRQEFEDGGGVVPFETPKELYEYHWWEV